MDKWPGSRFIQINWKICVLTPPAEGYSPWLELRWWRVNSGYGRPPGQQRASGDLRRNGETSRPNSRVIPHIQEPYEPRILA